MLFKHKQLTAQLKMKKKNQKSKIHDIAMNVLSITTRGLQTL